MNIEITELVSPNQTLLVDCDFQTDDYAPSFECFEVEFTPELIERIRMCMSILQQNPWMAHICIDTIAEPVSEYDGEYHSQDDISFEAQGLRVYTNCFYAFGQQDGNAQNQYESARMEFGDNNLVIIKP